MISLIKKYFIIRHLKNRFYSWDSSTLENHQEKRLRFILKYIKKYSPYYSNILKVPTLEIEDIPIINKQIMMDNYDHINTKGLKKEDLINFRMKTEKHNQQVYYNDLYSVGLSSGTSGNKGLTVLSKEERSLYTALLYARSGIPVGIKKNILFALRVNNPTFMEMNKFNIKLVYIDYTYSVDKIVELINKKELNVLAGPPSLLKHISSKIDEIIPKIDFIICYAEVLDIQTKQYLEDKFNCRVSQIYQGAEGFIASTCKDGNLHLNEDILYFELESVDNSNPQIKKVILTDLYRQTQPIIRYSINDLIEIDDKKCTCGSVFRLVKQIHGRLDDVFILKDKDNIERMLFPDYIRRSINQASDVIQDYQAIQKAFDTILIRLLLKNDTNRKIIENNIKKNLNYWLSKMNCELPEIRFEYKSPQVNPRSKKLIRILKDFK